MRIGVIGTGSMGQMLAKSFASDGDNEIYLYNRTAAKAEILASCFPTMQVSANLQELVCASDYVLLCTKAEDGKSIMSEIRDCLRPGQILLTSISSISLAEWATYTHIPFVKFIPSITQSAESGIVLLTFSSQCSPQTINDVLYLFAQIATPQIIHEHQVRISSDLTSCGPAFLSYILRAWAQAAADTQVLNFATAESMLREMLIGVAKLLENGMTFETILARVTVPGGITACGLQAFGETPRELFTDLHRVTQSFSHGASPTPSPARLKEI